ncbi:carbonic anhydrase [Allostella sp. ATCC 35155]|nr:carbonic anhydrase [Stella sp. ATCC 35155]
METLLEGYRRFRSDIWPAERDRYERLAKRGQRPETLVVACSDSRVDPQTVFGAVPGELFVVRNVAALVPPYSPDSQYHGTSAALEFGVRVLKVRQIVVLGHAQCGGVRAMVEGSPEEARDFVEPWIQIAWGVRELVPQTGSVEERIAAYEAGVIGLSLDNLRTFPWIGQPAAEGRIGLHGFSFDIHTGVLSRLTGPGRLDPVA